MNWKKMAIIAGVALVIYLIVQTPDRASGMVNDGLDSLGGAAENVSVFFGGIF